MTCKINPTGGACQYDTAGRCKWCNGKLKLPVQMMVEMILSAESPKGDDSEYDIATNVLHDAWRRTPLTEFGQWSMAAEFVADFLLAKIEKMKDDENYPDDEHDAETKALLLGVFERLVQTKMEDNA